MKKAVTLAAIAGITLASKDPRRNIFFDDNLSLSQPKTSSRSNFSIFEKRRGENGEKHEQDDEFMTLMEYLKSQPKVISVAERPIKDVVIRVPTTTEAPVEQSQEEGENNNNKPKRTNFSIFERKETEKTEKTEDPNQTKTGARTNFSILTRKDVNSVDDQHVQRDLETLFSKWLGRRDVKAENELYGFRDWRRGDKDSDKAGTYRLDDEENELYGLRDLKRGDKDSKKAGVLGFDDEADNDLRVLGNLIHDGLDIYHDVHNKDYKNLVSHGIKVAQDVHELTRKRNFLGN